MGVTASRTQGALICIVVALASAQRMHQHHGTGDKREPSREQHQ